MREDISTILAIVLFATVCHGFTGEYRDIMSNCRLEGGYCFNPAHPAGGGSMDPGEAAEAAGGAAPAAGGRRRGPNPLGRAGQPPPMSFGTQMNMLSQQCMSYEFELGCLSGGGNGMCCIPFP